MTATPALLVATATLGLLPLLLRAEAPPGMGSLELTIDTALRVLALLMGLTLVASVVDAELGGQPWSEADRELTAALAGWTLMALAGQFLLVARHRLWIAAYGERRRPRELTPPAATWTIFPFSLGVVTLVWAALTVWAAGGPRSSTEFIRGVMWGGALAGALLVLLCWALVRIYSRTEGRLPVAAKTARLLDGVDGGWLHLQVTADGVDPDVDMSICVWERRGRWLAPIKDAQRLARFHGEAAGLAQRPSLGLHARRLTFDGTSGWWWRELARPAFGLRVWDPTDHRTPKRWRAHRAAPFDHTDYAGLPSQVRGYLVPVTSAMLEEAGLRVSVGERDATER